MAVVREELTSLYSNLLLKNSTESLPKSARSVLLACYLQQQRSDMMTKLCEPWVERHSRDAPCGTFSFQLTASSVKKKKKKNYASNQDWSWEIVLTGMETVACMACSICILCSVGRKVTTNKLKYQGYSLWLFLYTITPPATCMPADMHIHLTTTESSLFFFLVSGGINQSISLCVSVSLQYFPDSWLTFLPDLVVLNSGQPW